MMMQSLMDPKYCVCSVITQRSQVCALRSSLLDSFKASEKIEVNTRGCFPHWPIKCAKDSTVTNTNLSPNVSVSN